MGKFTKLENMMLNIVDYGQQQILKDIEAITEPIRRYNERHLFFKALDKLNTQGKEKLS